MSNTNQPSTQPPTLNHQSLRLRQTSSLNYFSHPREKHACFVLQHPSLHFYPFHPNPLRSGFTKSPRSHWLAKGTLQQQAFLLLCKIRIG